MRAPLDRASFVHLCWGLARAARMFNEGRPMPPSTSLPPPISTILLALEERLTALEESVAARSAPAAQVQQAFHDILEIYNTTGQTGSVMHKQHAQLQALAEAFTLFLTRMGEHDKRSGAEQAEIHGVMIQVRQLARRQVAQLDDIERRAEMTEGERAAVRDMQEEQAT
jgi:hypothetical protein